MRSLVRASSLFLVLWANLGTLAQSQPPEPQTNPMRYLPPGEGESALTVLPVRYGDGGNSVEPLSPTGLEVHFTPYDDSGVELSYPAGSWVQPPNGHYRFWLQGEWRMSPYSGLLIFSGSDNMRAVLPIGEAGRVTLAEENTDPRLELHLLHAGSYLEKSFLRWEISPRRPADELGDGVLMPEGKAVGALWDREDQRYVALSRPFEVRGRKTVEIRPERPQGVAHLLAEVKRYPPLPSSPEDLNVDLVLQHDGGERPPDLKVITADKVYAVWYGLTPGKAELRVELRQTFLAQKVDLLPGRVESLTGQLEPWPALDVELNLPAPLRDGKLSLEVRRLPAGDVIAHHDLEPAAHAYRFGALPPALLEVDLKTRLGSFTRQVDLSSKRDGFLLLKPELVTLRGTVFRGDEAHPAKLTFTPASQKPLEVRADENGVYELVCLQPLRSVAIELAGIKAAPWVDFFTPAIKESKELDFYLSDADFTVKVTDAATRKAIFKASVDFRNAYKVAAGDEEEGRRNPRDAEQQEKVVSQSTATDASGIAWLPPLRKGDLEIWASAEGYLPLREPVQAQVLDEKKDQAFEVLLEPAGETAVLRMRLPDGRPASGAEVLLVDSLAAGRDLFSARADGDGLIRVPRRLVGVLLVRHPSAAFLVREWRAQEEGREAEWFLPPAAGRTLTVQVKDASGKSPAAKAELAFWVAGRRLSGQILAWLSGAIPLADTNGYWIGRNFPPGPVEVLAWTPQVRDEAGAGRLDSQAMGVQFPWPDPVEVRAVE